MRFDAALLDNLMRWNAVGVRACLATIVEIRGSAPRRAGTAIAIGEDGSVHGALSNGCIEAEIVEASREVFADGARRVLRYGVGDGVGTGLSCGGEIVVLLERIEDAYVAAAADHAASREPYFILVDDAGRRIEDERPVLLAAGDDLAFDSSRNVLAMRVDPQPRLILLGAGDVTEALAVLGRRLGFRPVLVDPRSEYVDLYADPSSYDAIVTAWPDEVVAGLLRDDDAAIVSLFHEQRFEIEALAYALSHTRAYVGALGSRRVQAARLEALRGSGVDSVALSRLHGPVGLDLGAHVADEIALSILAEIVAYRNGRRGGPLKDGSGSIGASPPEDRDRQMHADRL